MALLLPARRQAAVPPAPGGIMAGSDVRLLCCPAGRAGLGRRGGRVSLRAAPPAGLGRLCCVPGVGWVPILGTRPWGGDSLGPSRPQ